MAGLNSFFALQRYFSAAKPTYRDIIRNAAKIGGQLFGPIPKNHRREFFCLDEQTWVWHEEWLDQNNKLQTKTTRYEVQKDRILKFQDGQYHNLDPSELRNFYQATELYDKKVRAELYGVSV